MRLLTAGARQTQSTGGFRMDKLHKQVRIAQRRLILQQFVGRLTWCLCVAFAAAAIAIAIGKFFVLPVDSTTWYAAWLGGAFSTGILAAAIWTYLRRSSTLEAAIELDRRFRLKERVSSMLALDDGERETEAGQALVRDAVRRVEALEVKEQFGVAIGRRAWAPLVPAALAVAIALLVSDKALESSAEANTTSPTEVKKQVKASTDSLRKKLAERRKEASDKGLTDAEDLFKRLEEGTKKLSEKQEGDRQKALVQLNDLAKDLEKRKQALGGEDRIKQQLNQMKDVNKGPADKVTKALGEGDFQKALDELKKLQQQVAADKLEPEEKQQLKEQLDEMKEKLQRAVDAHEQAMKDLKQQLDKAKQAGDTPQADKLQQQLDKLAQKAPGMQKLQQMADKLGQAADKMQQGDAKEASEALDQIADDLAAMKKELDEAEMLDQALDEIAEAKDAMGCKKCAGAGCEHCQGGMGRGQGQLDGPPGEGLGEGKGQGARPEKRTDTGAYDSRVRQNVGKGSAVITDMVDGPNIKGKVLEDIKTEIENAKHRETDPLTGQRLPRTHRDHAKEYFDAFREEK
jgi:hypothetical protein